MLKGGFNCNVTALGTRQIDLKWGNYINDKHGVIYVISAKKADDIDYTIDRQNLEALMKMQTDIKNKPLLM